MSKITTSDRSSCKILRHELDVELAKLGEKLGLDITLGKMTYGGTTMSVKLTAALLTTNGVAQTKERKALEFHYPQMVDKVIEINGDVCTITGYHDRRYKKPIQADLNSGNGRFYKLTVESAERYIAASEQ